MVCQFSMIGWRPVIVNEGNSMPQMNRRRFLQTSVLVGFATATGCSTQARPNEQAVNTSQPATTTIEEHTSTPDAPKPSLEPKPTSAPITSSEPASRDSAYIAVVHGQDASAITQRAVEAIGGIERFVKSGYDVIIKPNICNANNHPEYASTTNPDVVAVLVRMCLGAGAKRVRVMDSPFSGTAQRAYVQSGIEDAVKAAGGEMELMSAMGFIDTDIPQGVDIQRWPIYQPILDADLVINVPIAKHHNLAKLTLGGKNLMGVIDNRGGIHRNLGQRLADLATVIQPQLTIIDAVRILVANGPTGGDLNDVKTTNTVIASHDMVACDSYATSLFGMKPDDIAYIRQSAALGLGQMDLSAVKLEEFSI